MSDRHDIALIGRGAIARSQHLPVLLSPENDTGLRLAAIVDRSAGRPDFAPEPGFAGPYYESQAAMLAAEPGIGAVSIATPTGSHYELAREALLAGRHVLLEKPPTVTLGEIMDLQDLAAARNLVLVTSFHARHNAAVERLRTILAERLPTRARIAWREDFQRWHPGQTWPWQPGGFGVFDPGINALSILCHVLPGAAFRVARARFRVPQGSATPAVVHMEFAWQDGAGEAAFEWRRGGEDVWNIAFEVPDGSGGTDDLLLRSVRTLLRNGEVLLGPHEDREYAGVYRGFARALEAGASEVSLREMRMIADAFTVAEVERGAGPLP